MALSASTTFKNAQSADVNVVTEQVYLILGDYANANSTATTASSSGDDATGNFPASGAINGDRTEINIGAASAADNGVGKASWRSANNVSVGNAPILYINFNRTVTINRIKLYHLSTNTLTSYVLSYYDGTNWIAFAATSDNLTGGTFGYGQGPYGETPYGGGTVAPTSITTTGKVDTIDFTEISTTQIKLIVGAVSSGNAPANVVELEVYRKVDITARLLGVKVDRRRDYKLSNNLASTATLNLDNSDGFFSPDFAAPAFTVTKGATGSQYGYGQGPYGATEYGGYSSVTPATTAASGYVNSELRPGLIVLIKFGFGLDGTNELISVFTGTIDRIIVNAAQRTAQIDCRDGIKGLIDQIVSTKLKTSQDIQLNLQYLLNLANISNYEQSLDSTTITLDYFFVYQQSIQTVVQQLVQASGDAQFWFDETGIATFKMYLNSVPQSQVYTSEADFEAGTLTNVDSVSNAGAIIGPWVVFDNFNDGAYNGVRSPVQFPTWTVRVGTFSAATNALVDTLNQNVVNAIDAPSTQSTGVWRFTAVVNNNSPAGTVAGDGNAFVFFQTTAADGSGNVTGYGLRFTMNTGVTPVVGPAKIHLMRYDNQTINSGTILATVGNLDESTHTWTITLDSGGNMNVYMDGVFQVSALDSTYVTATKIGVAGKMLGASNQTLTIDDITLAPLTLQGTWVSASKDQGATVVSEGILNATYNAPANTTIVFYTATSADNVTYSAYQSVVPGNTIGSPVQRYIKCKVVFTSSIGITTVGVPVVFDVTLNWATSAGSAKSHSTADFTFTSNDVLLDMQQELSDNLGGDAAIVNDITVTSAPIILSGANSDLQWQGTNGAPAAAISGTNTLSVSVGDTKYQAIISGGMDTTNMSGANPSAATVTAGTATFTWTFTTIHPTKPVLDINVTGAGTITALTLNGKKFSNATTPFQYANTDAKSIALFGRKALSISNNYIISNAVAKSIGDRILLNFKIPVSYIPKMVARPTWTCQLGDRITVKDISSNGNLGNTGLNTDYTVIGVTHELAASGNNARASTTLVLIKVS